MFLVDPQNARDLDDPATAFTVVLDLLDESASKAGQSVPDETTRAEMLAVPTSSLLRYLAALSAASDRPLVLFLDRSIEETFGKELDYSASVTTC